MAGTINIPLGLSVTDLLSNFKVAGSAVNSFTTQFKAQFDGLKGSADAPNGALSSMSRQLTITKRQISDLIAVGAPIPTELASKFTLLKGSVDSVRGAFTAPIQLAPFAALNQKLSDTKAQMQDLLAKGSPVPTELAQRFRALESQVASVNREFAKVPTQAEKFRALGSSLTSIGKPLSILSAGITYLGAASFKSYGDIDGIQRALTVTAGSAQEAGKQFKEFVQLSRLPGLGLDEVVQAGLSLETLGYKARTAEKYVAEVGNAIALGGKGKVEFGQVITQFTQMAGKAKVLGDDLKPIVNASPVIAKAINDMFGTIDSEEISKKLQAAGKGPKDFIADLVSTLSTLQRVQGGPKNAMENLGDSVKLAEFQIAKAADSVFGLTGKLEGLGNFVGRAADSFSTMPPALQGTILGMVGVVTAAGPLTLGVGGALRAFASLDDKTSLLSLGLKGLQSAFLFLTGPIGLVVAGVAALGYAAYSIYSFNKATQASVTVAGEMNSAYKESTAAIAGQQTQLTALVATAKNETLTKETRISAIKQLNQLSPKYLGDLTLETINTQKASGELAQYVRVLELKARAQIYSNRAAEASVKITDLGGKKLSEFVDTKDAFAATLQGVANTFTGGESGAQVLQKKAKDRKAQAIKDAETVLKTSQMGLQSAIDQLAKSGETISLSPQLISYKNTNLAADSELKQAKDKLKSLKEQIFAANKAGQDTSSLVAEAKATKDQIDAITASLKTQKAAHEGVGSALTTNERISKKLNHELKEQGDSASESLKNQAAAMQALADKGKGLIKSLNQDRVTTKVDPIDLGSVEFVKPIVPVALGVTLDPVQSKNTNAQAKAIVDNLLNIKSASSALFSKTESKDFLSSFQLAGPSLDAYRNKIEEIKLTIATLALNKEIVPPELLDQLRTLKKAVGDAFGVSSAADAQTNPGVQGEVDGKYIKKAQEQIAQMLAQGKQVKQTAEQMAKDMQDARDTLTGKGVDLLTAIGEGIGKGENPLKIALKTILDFLGDFMIRIGSAMVLGGTLLSAAITAFPFLAPFLGIKGPAGIIAGGALVVGGGVVKGFAGSFEGGGLIRGSSLIQVGESPKALAGGGEFVAPVALGADLISARIMKSLNNQLKLDTPDPTHYRQPGPVDVNVNGEFVLEGSKLRIALNRADRDNYYLR